MKKPRQIGARAGSYDWERPLPLGETAPMRSWMACFAQNLNISDDIEGCGKPVAPDGTHYHCRSAWSSSLDAAVTHPSKPPALAGAIFPTTTNRRESGASRRAVAG